jgi:PTS system nitrogen regulatory IIA component
MDIKEFLSAANVFADFHATDKGELLRELCHRAAWKAGLDGETVTGEVLKRESVGSTGMGGGVAIPHARIPGLSKTFGLLARLDEAIDFEAIDGELVDVVALLLLPRSSDNQPLNALACTARCLRDAQTLRRMRQAGDSAELYRAVAADIGSP